eukprot:s1926_g8.t2
MSDGCVFSARFWSKMTSHGVKVSFWKARLRHEPELVFILASNNNITRDRSPVSLLAEYFGCVPDMNCQCRGVSSRSHGFFKPLLLVLVAALCPSAAFSNELEVVSGPEPPVYFAEGRKEELRKLEEGFEHQTEVKVKTTEDICISMMLLGCMGFMMANFYLINWPDEDIKRISWEVISSTISIFSAVLLFQACNKVLEYYILEDLWIWYQLVIDMMHMSAWFLILQLTLAYFSGALGEHHEVGKHRLSIMSAAATESMSDFRAKLQRENSAKEHFEAVEANVECYAILLGHITGFAAINAWGTLQQAVPRNLVWCGLVPVITLVGILCIYAGTDTLREYKTLADDEEDEWEKLWDEEVAETEDDVMALAVSFLLVQVLRFGISGQLPNSEGEDEEGTQHSTRECGMLLLAAAAFGCFEILKITFRKAIRKALGQRASDGHAGAAHGEKEDPSVWDRLNHVWIRDICAMCTAWSLHFAVDWFLTTNLDVEGAVSAVVCAVVVTCLALGLIFVLDKLADMEFTDDEVDAALRALITSLGILIGFSWERSFDAAVGGLAEQRAFGLAPPVITLLLAIILASMVVPAWKWYILPTTLKYKKEAHHASHNDHEHGSTEHGELHDAEAPSQSADLSEPLLTGKKEVSFREGEPDVIVQSSQGKDEAQKRLEAQAKQLAELQAALAAKEQEVQEARRSSLALKETCEKAERKNIDLAAACEKARAGARLHADRAVQLEGSLQEKDKALHQRTAEAATLQEDAKRLNAEVTRLQKSTGEQAALTNKLQTEPSVFAVLAGAMCDCGCCLDLLGGCFKCLYDMFRSIPVPSIAAFFLFLTGYGLAVSGRTQSIVALDQMGLVTLTGLLGDLGIGFFLALIFNILSVLAAFLASGKTRETIFSRADYCCIACFQFLLGRCALSLILAGSLAMLMIAAPLHRMFWFCKADRFQDFTTFLAGGVCMTSCKNVLSFSGSGEQCVEAQDTVLLFGVASASSLVLQVDAACGLRSVMGSVIEAVSLLTGTKISLEAFDQICSSNATAGFTRLAAGTCLLVLGQTLLMVFLSSNYTRIVLQQGPYAVSEHATKLKLLDERREEEMTKAQVRIVDSEAAAQKWEQRATAEAQRSADLEASLRLREKQLETLKVQKASEIDHMSAVATERDRELRQLQADGTGQDVVAKLQAENRQLQQMLDNATAKVKEGLDEQMSLQQQKLQLQEEVRRLEQVSPTKTPRSAAMTPSRPVSIPSTSVAMPLNPSTSSLPGTGSGATIGQAGNSRGACWL